METSHIEPADLPATASVGIGSPMWLLERQALLLALPPLDEQRKAIAAGRHVDQNARERGIAGTG